MEISVPEREIINARVFAASRDAVFTAFADPRQLARWWGPRDFTNTIHEFDLRPGGYWRLAMRGPDGSVFENESQFLEVTPPARVVLRHLEPVHAFEMTMTFAEQDGRTTLTWIMRFDSAEECARVRDFVTLANEQNFDRLEAVLRQRGLLF